jgi:UDP-glucose 4-epimerase
MKVLITGGMGFIGQSLIENLENEIIVIDNLNTSEYKKRERVEFHNIDLSNPSKEEIEKIEEILKEVKLVYHFASSVGVKYIDKNPESTLLNSFKINNILFPLFEKYKVKVIFASTSEVYGETQNAKETDTLKIGSPDKLRWGYACSKLMSEFLLKAYKFESVIVRFFNVTGPKQLSNYGMVLPTFIEKAKKNEEIIIYGDGEQYRSFCDIRDAIEMLKEVGFNENCNNEIYNIGNERNTINIKSLALKVIELTNSKSEIKFKNYKDDFSDEFGEIYERKPNTEKITKLYKSKYNLEELIKSMI